MGGLTWEDKQSPTADLNALSQQTSLVTATLANVLAEHLIGVGLTLCSYDACPARWSDAKAKAQCLLDQIASVVVPLQPRDEYKLVRARAVKRVTQSVVEVLSMFKQKTATTKPPPWPERTTPGTA